MPEMSPDELKHAVEAQHGGKATFVQAVPVHEEHVGQLVWDGAVHVFMLTHQPNGQFRAYAWSTELPDGTRRIVTFLHTPDISSPREAVRAAIAAEAQAGKRLI